MLHVILAQAGIHVETTLVIAPTIPSSPQCHSERSEEIPPSLRVRGLGGCSHVTATALCHSERSGAE